jgi:hypothetical protein
MSNELYTTWVKGPCMDHLLSTALEVKLQLQCVQKFVENPRYDGAG